MPPSLAVPYLLYDDAQAALDWVVAALGFTITDTQLDKSGALFHAKVHLSEARIMLGAPGPNARYGGTVLDKPSYKPWGDRTFGICDHQGQCWHFHQRPAS